MQAIGGILNIRWAHSGIVTTGPYCTAQGLIEQIGELGVALITLVCPVLFFVQGLADPAYQFLAVHTFVAAVLPEQVGPARHDHPPLNQRGIALSLVCLACVFITLWAAIGAGIHKNYETPTPVRSLPLSFPRC